MLQPLRAAAYQQVQTFCTLGAPHEHLVAVVPGPNSKAFCLLQMAALQLRLVVLHRRQQQQQHLGMVVGQQLVVDGQLMFWALVK